MLSTQRVPGPIHGGGEFCLPPGPVAGGLPIEGRSGASAGTAFPARVEGRAQQALLGRVLVAERIRDAADFNEFSNSPNHGGFS